MCVPGPGLLAEEGPRAWPGSVRVGADIAVLSEVVGLVVVFGMRCDRLRTFWGKVESDVCARRGERRVRVPVGDESTWVSFSRMRGWRDVVESSQLPSLYDVI
jgi:hypothetical protein